MNISITCRHKTQVTRYKKKILQEIRSTQHLDASISQINLVFSIVSNKPSTISPIKCHLFVKHKSGWLEIFNHANSEIRAFSLCFEELLYLLLKVKEKSLEGRDIKQIFPYLSISLDSVQQFTAITEERV